MTTINTMSNRSILQLPTEIFHLIFDYLNCRTIAITLGRVSQEIHEIVNSYDRLKINFSTLSDSDLQLLSQFIKPQNVIAISLSAAYSIIDEPHRMTFLFSLFKFNEFIRLKSLKLIGIVGENFHQLFEHIHKHSLKSLSIILSYHQDNEIHRIINFCSSTILPYGLKHIDLNLPKWTIVNIDKFEPIQHVLRNVTVNDCTYEQYHRILSSYVNLKKLSIQNYIRKEEFSTISPSLAQSNYPQLKSLTINTDSLIFNQLCSILSLTTSLVHLEINLANLESDCILNGTDWEEFLRNKLMRLMHFQFHFIRNTESIDFHRSLSPIIGPFKTPFWLTEKHWIVVCDFLLQSSAIILYTLPSSIDHGKAVVRSSAVSLNNDHYLTTGKRTGQSDHLSMKKVSEIVSNMTQIHKIVS